jgi:hypothetical protein
MKIATFNINNVNKRLTNLLAWLKTAKPDVVCLQELKAADREFPQDALAKAGCSAPARRQHRRAVRRAWLPAPGRETAGQSASPGRKVSGLMPVDTPSG